MAMRNELFGRGLVRFVSRSDPGKRNWERSVGAGRLARARALWWVVWSSRKAHEPSWTMRLSEMD